MSTRRKSQRQTTQQFMQDLEDDLVFELQATQRFTDDAANSAQNDHIANLMEVITRIGGDVCRMRSEVDGLLEQNAQLVDAFTKLRTVIEEKGQFSLDDFDLACEVLDTASAPQKPEIVKKFAH